MFPDNRPPTNQLQATKELIATGVKLGFIEPDYTLFGHRQLGNTECPGEALFQEIEDWQRIYGSNETENIIKMLTEKYTVKCSLIGSQ